MCSSTLICLLLAANSAFYLDYAPVVIECTDITMLSYLDYLPVLIVGTGIIMTFYLDYSLVLIN